MSEAGVHFDFYFHLRGAIEADPQRGQRTYDRVEPEYTSEDLDGRADLVLFDTSDSPALVIEAKRPGGAPSRDIDPYAPAVIKQAHGYASQLGTPYFATFNGDRLVLFNTHEQGVPLLQRSTKSYEIADVGPFADTLLDEIARLEADRISWDSLDDAFIERVRTLHELLAPKLENELTAKLDADSEFRGSFVEWATAQGIEYDAASATRQTEVRERFAEEGAYLLANKVLFYKILEAAPAYSDEVRPLAIRANHARPDLEDSFEEIVANVDFEAVFEHDPIYSEIPLTSVGKRINEFITELDDQDLTQFDSDVIGRIYEGVIPPKRRHELGEYYTPPPVCDLITRLTIDEASDRVLDPACGSGGFPVSAYHRKFNLLPEPTGSHERLLAEIYGIDINRFPAHLTAINLALQDLDSHTDDVGVEVADFFNVAPDTARFGRRAAGASGERYEHGDGEALGGFDVVVGNPPYIRSANIAETVDVRSHLTNKGVDAADLSESCDIYAYFLTHATEFLSDDGRLGFITSDSWLQTKYGEDVQAFVLDNYSIEAIIKFDNQVFEDALVGTCVVILQREPDNDVRDENVVKFLRIKERIDVEKIAELVEEPESPDQMRLSDEYRLVTRSQQVLYEENKWSIFFLAPQTYFEIVDTDASVPFTGPACQHRANTSGANDFFHLREDDGDGEEFGLEQYVSPLAKASGQMDRILFSEADAEEWDMLDVHDLVEKALKESDSSLGESDSDRVKKWLRQNEHASLVEYVEWGERQEMHTGGTCASRNIWFDLGDLDRTSILFPRFTWRVFRVIWNEANATANDQFYNVHTDHDEKVLCGILNSRLIWMFYELHGRTVGGEGMNRTEIKGYEIDSLPIPDIETMSADEKERIRTAFDNLLEHEREFGSEVLPEDEDDERDALDRAVLAAIGLEERADEIRRAVDGLLTMREQGGGINTGVLVERTSGTLEDPEVIDLPGVSDTRESTTLGDYE